MAVYNWDKKTRLRVLEQSVTGKLQGVSEKLFRFNFRFGDRLVFARVWKRAS